MRTIAEAFDAAPASAVTGIVFNGYASTKDKSTGQPVRPLLISINAERDKFAQVNLDEPELDPVLCLRNHQPGFGIETLPPARWCACLRLSRLARPRKSLKRCWNG